MSAIPVPDPEAELLALRQRLRAARAERGACPPWEELRDDLLPGGSARAGRAERIAHRELCPYCDAHIREWERSLDHTSDALGAIEKGVARGVVAGAKRLVGLAASGESAPSPAPPQASTFTDFPAAPPAPPAPPPLTLVPRAPAAPKPPTAPKAPAAPRAPAPRLAAVPPVEAVPPRPVAKPAPRPRAKTAPPPAVSAESEPLRLLVVEADHESAIPESVFLCALVLGAEVASVPRIESLGGDPDLDAICAVIVGGGRASAEWPEAVRRAKDLAPGRPVVVLAPFGTEPPSGARRALGAHLVGASDPAERLLVALDARLR